MVVYRNYSQRADREIERNNNIQIRINMMLRLYGLFLLNHGKNNEEIRGLQEESLDLTIEGFVSTALNRLRGALETRASQLQQDIETVTIRDIFNGVRGSAISSYVGVEEVDGCNLHQEHSKSKQRQ